MRHAEPTRAPKSAARATSQRDDELGTAVLAPPRYGIDFIDRTQTAATGFDPREAVAIALAQKPAPEPEAKPEAQPREPGLGLTAGRDQPEQPRPPIDAASSPRSVPLEPPADDVAREPEPQTATLASPRSPEQDPEFAAYQSRVTNRAASQARHGSGPDKASAGARAAAIKPGERSSQAQRDQVATMATEAEHPPSFDQDAFVKALLAEVERIAPKNKDDVLEFENSGKAKDFDDVKTGMGKSVASAQAGVQAPLAAASKQPAPAKPDRQVTPLSPEGRGPDPGSVRADRAMPPPRTQAEMDLAPATAEAKQPLTDSPTTRQLVAELPNDPTLGEAGRTTAELDHETEAGPLRYRADETKILTETRTGASAEAGKLLAGMVGQRGTSFAQVAADQRTVKSDNERRRDDAAKQIDTIFQSTKTRLDKRLTRLDTDVNQTFDREAERATKDFREFIEKEADKYKKTWLQTAYESVVEIFVGPLPKPIHDFYEKGRKQFIADMREVIAKIGKLIQTGLDDAKAIVADGRKRVEATLDTLGDELADFKREIAEQIDGRFAELDSQIAARRRSLVSGLAKRYVAAVTKLDEIEAEVRSAHQNLLEQARDAIIAAKDYVVGQLQRLAEIVGDAAGSIIANPGRFLSNMAKGIIGGFELFAANIGPTIKGAVIEWLTGNLGAAGITLPTTWDAKGIIGFLLELVGLGLSNIMAIARKVFGERVIAAIERGVAGFEKVQQIFDILRKDGVAGLWEYLKDEFLAYKEKLMGEAGQALAEGLVVAGVKKAIGLLSGLATGGLGTLITIVSMIIDTVRWVINNGPRLIELIKTITAMVHDVMAGRVDAIATAVDQVLKRLLPVVLGFVGALVGVDPVIAKIQKIFQKIREPATKLITALFTKIRDGLKWLIDKIVGGAKSAAGAVVAWWKQKVGFKVRGAAHSVFIEKVNGPIMVASDKHPVNEWLELDSGGKKTARDQPAVFSEIKAAHAAAEAARAAAQKAPDADKPAKQKLFEAALAKLGAALAKADSLGKPVLPKSRLTVAPKSIVTAKGPSRVGGLMHAKPLTMLADPSRPDYVGSGPDDKSLWWREINLHRPNTYVQGHLLNDHIHGPGIDQNLAPITRGFNNPMMLNAIETSVKDAVKSGKVVEYRVEVNYTSGQRPADHPNATLAELALPSAWTMQAWELGCDSSKPEDFDKPESWTKRTRSLGSHYNNQKDPYCAIDTPTSDTRPTLNAGTELLREAGGLDHNVHRELPNVRIALGIFANLADLERKFASYGTQIRADRKAKGLDTDPDQIWGEQWQKDALAAIKACINRTPKGIVA